MGNPRHPHEVVITRVTDSNPFDITVGNEPVYSGVCRSYQRAITSGRGDVIGSVRVLSIPVSLSEWNVVPKEGDWLDITIGSLVERGYVVDKLPHNLGTDLIWDYRRV